MVSILCGSEFERVVSPSHQKVWVGKAPLSNQLRQLLRLPSLPKHLAWSSTSAVTASLYSLAFGWGHRHRGYWQRSLIIDQTQNEENHLANRRDLLLQFS